MDTTRTEPNGKVQVHRVPPAAPGKCVVCGFSGDVEDSRLFIDFGFDIDYYGVVYFCSLCMTEVANAIGFVSIDQYTKIQTLNMELVDRVEELTNERDASTNALRAYLNGRPGVGAVLESEELPKRSEAIERPANKKPRPKSTTSSDVKESGPDDSSSGDGDIISLG